ncbi:MAG: hypothetical protein LCH41_01685 [Armatimonadetes bacterium]|nr:hypothetical protein [Armatimonadota bacterium]
MSAKSTKSTKSKKTTAPSPARGFGFALFKWFLVPVGVAAAGFYFIGPQIGSVPALEATAKDVTSAVQGAAAKAPVASAARVAPSSAEEEPRVKLNVKVEEDDGKERKKKEQREETAYFTPDASQTLERPSNQRRTSSEEDTAPPSGEDTTLGDDPAGTPPPSNTGGW